MEFSQKLKTLRQKNGDTQNSLAKKLHVSQNAVYNWENGKREPNLETLLLISDLYNVSTDFLMGISEKEERLCDLTTFTDEIDNYTQELGEFLYYNPDHKGLFDASMEVKPGDVKLATEMLNRINGKKSPSLHIKDMFNDVGDISSDLLNTLSKDKKNPL